LSRGGLLAAGTSQYRLVHPLFRCTQEELPSMHVEVVLQDARSATELPALLRTLHEPACQGAAYNARNDAGDEIVHAPRP
jgi:hypothetical protein